MPIRRSTPWGNVAIHSLALTENIKMLICYASMLLATNGFWVLLKEADQRENLFCGFAFNNIDHYLNISWGIVIETIYRWNYDFFSSSGSCWQHWSMARYIHCQSLGRHVSWRRLLSVGFRLITLRNVIRTRISVISTMLAGRKISGSQYNLVATALQHNWPHKGEIYCSWCRAAE